jgi:LuxR family maltose regulon positive regulatory protein
MPRPKRVSPPLKFNLPTVRGKLVERPRLTAIFAESRVTALVAAAGMGKTTLAMQWAAAFPGAVCWISMTAGDDSPRAFWSFALGMLSLVEPQVAETPSLLLSHEGDHLSDSFVDALLDSLAHLRQPLALMIDEAQVIQNPALIASLVRFGQHLPAGGQLILVGRALDPALLALAKPVSDLAFTYEEIHSYFTNQFAAPLQPEFIKRIYHATKGWAMGVKLAEISLRGGQPTLQQITKYTSDYLLEEVLRNIPGHLLDFMLHTCVCEMMQPALCDALTNAPHSAEQLETLLNNGLFITRESESPLIYRYHPLFREALLEHGAQHAPALLNDAHRRAAEWYAQVGLYHDAAVHAAALNDIALTAHYALEASRQIILMRDFLDFREWLTRFPDSLLDEQPRLRLFAIIAAMMLNADVTTAQMHFDKLQAREDAHHLQGEIALAQMYMLWQEHIDTAETVAPVEKALATLPHDVLYAHALHMASFIYENLRKPERAAEMIEQQYQVAREIGTPAILLHALNNLIYLRALSSDITAILSLTDEALKLISQTRHLRSVAPALLLDAERAIRIKRARALFQRGTVAEAEQVLQPAFQHLELANPHVLWACYCLQAEIQGLRQDFESVDRLFAKAGLLHGALAQHGHFSSPLNLHRHSDESHHTKIFLRWQNTDAARRWLEHAQGDDEKILFEIGTAQVTGQAHLVLGQIEEGLAELTRVHTEYRTRGKQSHAAQILPLLALGHWLHGDESAARAALDLALDQTLRSGDVLSLSLSSLVPFYRRCMLDYWEAGADDHAEQLRQAIALLGENAPALPIEPFTALERDVARLIVDNHSSSQIMDALYLSDSGLRRLLRGLHRKMKSSTRSVLIKRLTALDFEAM